MSDDDYGDDQTVEKNLNLLHEQAKLRGVSIEEVLVGCHHHGVNTTFGQLSGIGKLALLAGLETWSDEKCLLLE